MTLQATMPGPDGLDVTAYKRSARQIHAGDYLPDYGAHAIGDALEDPDDGSLWVTLETGQDIRITTRRVWMHRRYHLADWQRDAVQAFRDARDARDALRESSTPAPAGVTPGAAGAVVPWCNLEREEFNRAYPAPRLADFLRAAAESRRAPERVA